MPSFPTARFAPAVGAACLLWTALFGAGCIVPQSQNVQGTTTKVTEPVTSRSYHLYLPQSYNPANRHPMVVSIHGMKPFDNAFPQLMTWRKICDEKGWIAMAPQLRSPDMLYQFPFRRIDRAILDDESLIVAAVQDVMKRYSVDPRYVMLTGWSSGGYLIHYIGAHHPELFTMIAPQGANFSEDIMPEYLTDAARRTPIYVYHGSGDLPVVVKDSNAAVQWYNRRGYLCVQMDEAPGGHERHPELAARYFDSHIRGTNAYTLASRAAVQTRMGPPGGPWLGPATPGSALASASRSGMGPTAGPAMTPMAATPFDAGRPGPGGTAVATTAGPTMAQPPSAARPAAPPGPSTDRPGPAVTPTLSPAAPTISRPQPTAAPTAAPSTPGIADQPAASAGPTRTPVTPTDASSSTGWEQVSPQHGPPAVGPMTARLRTESSTPAVTPAKLISIAATPRKDGVVLDTPEPVGPLGALTVAMPLGPGPRPAPTGKIEETNPRAEYRISDPDRVGAPEVTAVSVTPTLAAAATRLLATQLPTHVTDRASPAASEENPVGELALSSADVSRPSPRGTAQPMHHTSSYSSVRVVASALQGTSPLTVEFRAEVRGISSRIVRYHWRLGEALFSTSHSAVLTFRRPGDYTIELTTGDAAGNTYRSRVVIHISPVEE